MSVVSPNVRSQYGVGGRSYVRPTLKRSPPLTRIKKWCPSCSKQLNYGHFNLIQGREHAVIEIAGHQPECEPTWERRMVRTRMKCRQIVESQKQSHLLFATISSKSNKDLAVAISNLQGNWFRFRNKAAQWKKRGHDHPWHRVYWWFAVMEITETKEGFHPHLHMLLFSRSRFNSRNFSWDRMHGHWHDENGSKMQMNFSPIGQIGRVHTRKAVSYLTKYFTKDKLLWGGLESSIVKANRHILKGCHFTRGYYRVPSRLHLYIYCCALGVTKVPLLRDHLLFICAHGARILAPG